MQMRDVDKEFERYLDSPEYDQAEGYLLDMIQAAFKAGFNAALKPDQPPDNIISIFEKEQPAR